MSDSKFVAHFTKHISDGDDEPRKNLEQILRSKKLKANSLKWTGGKVVCFTECPWSSLLKHFNNYSPYGVGFTKRHVFAAGGGPVYYVRRDHWNKLKKKQNSIRPENGRDPTESERRPITNPLRPNSEPAYAQNRWLSEVSNLNEEQNLKDHINNFTTPFWPSYRHESLKEHDAKKKPFVDYTYEREWRVPRDFTFKLDDIKFVVLPDYKAMERFPRDLKEGIGWQKFILRDVYLNIEDLWPTHIVK